MRGRNSLSQGERLEIVNRWVANCGSIANAARSAGISRQALSAQANGDKPFSETVLRSAGIKKVVEVSYYILDEI